MKLHKKLLPKMDYTFLCLAMGLLFFGLIALSSASSVMSFERFGNNSYYFLRQLMFGAIPGLIFMFVLSRIDYHILQKFAPLLIIAGIFLLILVLVPGIGFKVGNARRWINLQYFLFQPAEYVKLAMIIYLASWFDKRSRSAHDFYYGFLPSITIVGLVAGLIVLEPDIGTMLSLVLVAAVMFFIGGVRIRYLLSAGAAGLLVMWILIKAAPYRLQRIAAYFNPSVDPKGISYQINQALLAIGSGGLWGNGFGQSRQKFNYLPEAIGDSVFAVISEELGFARVLIIILLFLFLAIRGTKIARFAPDNFGKLLAVGITSWIVIQALINIGGITALIPLTGIPLPFISYGSTALAVNLAGIGILLNISRFSPIEK
ncbi:MAG: putative lipid II flippase FtsW [Candidatus Doudnabacteria bacterium]|nr:putative lipid II flippase FtsW [Candidatus Doudnabacteria bacterium]